MSILDIARQYVASGLSVLPIRTDGSKAPTLPKGRVVEYRDTRYPTDDELVAWFADGNAGLAVACGALSGNLAVPDFESALAWEQWLAAIPENTRTLLAECPVVRTPGGGAHIWVRLPGPVPGGKLAHLASGTTKIEVRGQGNYVLAPGCPPSCHSTGRTYEFAQRGWLETPADPVPFDVWFVWSEVAESLTERRPEPQSADAPRPERVRTNNNPGDDFNRRGTWEQTGLFDVAGWVWTWQQDRESGQVRRPGKSHGVSGTVGMVTSQKNGWPLFHCFTSNGYPFEGDRSYDRFGVFTRVQHSGDFKAATRALGCMGYGKQESKPPMSTTARQCDGPVIGQHDGTKAVATLVSRPLIDVEEKPIRWLWPGRVPAGALTVLDGDPALGKSLITIDLAARLTTGLSMPFSIEPAADPAGVMFLAAEDSAEHVIRPRARVAGVDLHRCRVSECIRIGDRERPIRMPDDIDALEREITAHGIGMLVIDPFLAFLAQTVDSHKDQSVRDVLHLLKLLAERTGAAVLPLRHLNKAGSGNALYRGMGSIAITAAARSVLTVDNHPSDTELRVLASAKCNIARSPKSLTYRIADRDGLPIVEWVGECDLTANDLGIPGGRPDRARDTATDFLLDILSAGSKPEEEIEKEAKREGIKLSTLRRAKRELGVKSDKTGFKGGWTWELPSADTKVLAS